MPLAERWGSPSSPLLWNHLEVGVIWLPRPSAVLVASWARDLASPPSITSRQLFQRCSVSLWRGNAALGCTISLQSPPSLTVLSDFCFVFFWSFFGLFFVHFTAFHTYTVEPPNKGQVGAWALVHYSGVVLYWGVFVKKPFLCVVSVYS